MQIDLTRYIRNQYFQFLMHLLVDSFLSIFMFIKRICWEVYLLFTRLPPTQAWMDPREQTLIIKYIQELKREKR
jgi:hypothetical protein